MNIEEIFAVTKNIGALSFSTRDGDTIHSRYAAFFSGDKDGLYLMTMHTKPFYRQMSETGKVAACGICTPDTKFRMDEKGMPIILPGFTFRITGDVREIPYEDGENRGRTSKGKTGDVPQNINTGFIQSGMSWLQLSHYPFSLHKQWPIASGSTSAPTDFETPPVS